MTEYTFEEKQQALDEANQIMNGGAEWLKGIEEYINASLARHTTPILNEDDLKILVSMAKKGVAK